MDNLNSYFASCPKNVSDLLAGEIRELGGTEISETAAGVYFKADEAAGYRFIMWSRLASRLFLQIASFKVSSPEDIYHGVRGTAWDEEFGRESSFTINSDLIRSNTITNKNFAAQKMKDAIADQFREKYGTRPAVDNADPGITLHLLIKDDTASVGIDLSGTPLHRRGYRRASGPAPLKENAAAAVLLRSGWKETAGKGGSFLDPFCGTGTLLIEAAMMAGDIAPGLLRSGTGMNKWRKYNPRLMEEIRAEASARRAEGIKNIPRIAGSDINRKAVSSALANIEAAGLGSVIHVEKRDFADLSVSHLPPGLMVSNPPYGERLEELEALVPLYRSIGKITSERLPGWRVAVLAGDIRLSKAIGLKPEKINIIYNGPIECTLAGFRIFSKEEKAGINEEISRKSRDRTPSSPGAEMFANRLRKNIKKLKKWRKKNGVTCYRIYDADMPEYSAAIDVYEDKWINLQEYAPPKEIPEKKAARHIEEMIDGILSVFPVRRRDIYLKVRKRQGGKSQYGKVSFRNEKKIIRENSLSFYVNLSDYLDTGIFLDHRPTRELIRTMSEGKDFLNLFAYTGTATVYAAEGGAASTTSVDQSNTYLGWAEENMKLNGFTGDEHKFVKADVLKWIPKEKKRFDLIFLDPPTFSNSKNMKETLDIQRDYGDLIAKTVKLLKKDGTLIFSTNFRKFRMNRDLFPDLLIEDITEKSIPADFERNRKIHFCWTIRRKEQ